MCIQYKGPYSFIVTSHLCRNSKTITTLKLQSRKWMTRKLKDIDLLWSLQVRKEVVGIEIAVIAETEGIGIAGEGKTSRIIAHHIHQVHPLRLPVVLLLLHLLTLVLLLQTEKKRERAKNDEHWLYIDIHIDSMRWYFSHLFIST